MLRFQLCSVHNTVFQVGEVPMQSIQSTKKIRMIPICKCIVEKPLCVDTTNQHLGLSVKRSGIQRRTKKSP